MNIKDATIDSRLFNWLYEQTVENVGKDSVLRNLALIFKSGEFDLGKFRSHVDYLRDVVGLNSTSSFGLKLDTKSDNMLDYYQGLIAFEMNVQGTPSLKLFLSHKKLARNLDIDSGNWEEIWGNAVSTIGVDLVEPLQIMARGDAFDLNDLHHMPFIVMICTLLDEAKEFIEKLPVEVPVGISEQDYVNIILENNSGNLVGKTPRFWNHIGLHPVEDDLIYLKQYLDY